eukprot:2829288-Amphidinium_carterae.1
MACTRLAHKRLEMFLFEYHFFRKMCSVASHKSSSGLRAKLGLWTCALAKLTCQQQATQLSK